MRYTRAILRLNISDHPDLVNNLPPTEEELRHYRPARPDKYRIYLERIRLKNEERQRRLAQAPRRVIVLDAPKGPEVIVPPRVRMYPIPPGAETLSLSDSVTSSDSSVGSSTIRNRNALDEVVALTGNGANSNTSSSSAISSQSTAVDAEISTLNRNSALALNVPDEFTACPLYTPDELLLEEPLLSPPELHLEALISIDSFYCPPGSEPDIGDVSLEILPPSSDTVNEIEDDLDDSLYFFDSSDHPLSEESPGLVFLDDETLLEFDQWMAEANNLDNRLDPASPHINGSISLTPCDSDSQSAEEIPELDWGSHHFAIGRLHTLLRRFRRMRSTETTRSRLQAIGMPSPLFVPLRLNWGSNSTKLFYRTEPPIFVAFRQLLPILAGPSNLATRNHSDQPQTVFNFDFSPLENLVRMVNDTESSMDSKSPVLFEHMEKLFEIALIHAKRSAVHYVEAWRRITVASAGLSLAASRLSASYQRLAVIEQNGTDDISVMKQDIQRCSGDCDRLQADIAALRNSIEELALFFLIHASEIATEVRLAMEVNEMLEQLYLKYITAYGSLLDADQVSFMSYSMYTQYIDFLKDEPQNNVSAVAFIDSMDTVANSLVELEELGAELHECLERAELPSD